MRMKISTSLITIWERKRNRERKTKIDFSETIVPLNKNQWEKQKRILHLMIQGEDAKLRGLR